MIAKNRKYYINPIMGKDLKNVSERMLAIETLPTLEENRYRKLFRTGCAFTRDDWIAILGKIFRNSIEEIKERIELLECSDKNFARYDLKEYEKAAKLSYLLSGEDFIIRDIEYKILGRKREEFLTIEMTLLNYDITPEKDFVWTFNNNNNHVGFFFKEANRKKLDLE